MRRIVFTCALRAPRLIPPRGPRIRRSSCCRHHRHPAAGIVTSHDVVVPGAASRRSSQASTSGRCRWYRHRHCVSVKPDDQFLAHLRLGVQRLGFGDLLEHQAECPSEVEHHLGMVVTQLGQVPHPVVGVSVGEGGGDVGVTAVVA